MKNGVNPLAQKDELCTIASIRLNEILELGKLDNHEGFSDMPERREDLKWIFDKYTIAEFLVAGATSPQDAVDLWYNTLGHKKLITGGEYSFGCIYAQNSFGVAITAFYRSHTFMQKGPAITGFLFAYPNINLCQN